MNVFEVVMYLMSKTDVSEKEKNKKIVSKINEIKSSNEFLDAIGNHRDNWSKVEKRFAMMDEILEEVYDQKI